MRHARTDTIAKLAAFIAVAMGLFGCSSEYEAKWLQWPWPDYGWWNLPVVQQCRSVGSWDWHNAAGDIVAGGIQGLPFHATFGDYAGWGGHDGEFCASPAGVRIPNQDACVWMCEQEAAAAGAVDDDCAHQVEAWWRVRLNDIEPYFSQDTRIQPNADGSKSYAWTCDPANYPFIPQQFPVLDDPHQGEEIWCLPDPLDPLNTTTDWDHDGNIDFDLQGARVMVLNNRDYPPNVSLLSYACGFSVIYTSGTPDETCRNYCRDVVQLAYLDVYGLDFSTPQLQHNCDTFKAQETCFAPAAPAGFPFLWDAAGGQRYAPLECGAKCCELAGAQACRNLQQGDVVRPAATHVVTLPATLLLSGASANPVTAAATVRISYAAPACTSSGGACPLYVESLQLSAPGPVSLPASSLWPAATLTDIVAQWRSPGIGAYWGEQLQIAPKKMGVAVMAKAVDRQGVGSSISTMTTTASVMKGSLKGGQITGLRYTLPLGSGIELRLDAGVTSGAVTPYRN